MKRTVYWPAHWEKARVRPGYWLVEGHSIKRDTPTAGAWTVRCPRAHGRFVGEGALLENVVDVLADHLWDCRNPSTVQDDTGPETEFDPAACAQAISDRYQPTCGLGRGDHCDYCLMCPGHHVDGCVGAEPLTIAQIAGPPRRRDEPWLRTVTVHLPEPIGATA
ncbi:hypothetical protein AB0425_17770 [Actinosynnema sp. NPDC051121]